MNNAIISGLHHDFGEEVGVVSIFSLLTNHFKLEITFLTLFSVSKEEVGVINMYILFLITVQFEVEIAYVAKRWKSSALEACFPH